MIVSKLKKAVVGLLVVAPIATVSVVALANFKHAALAYSEATHRYGWAADQGSKEEAERKALNECGAGCTVRLHWDRGCGAYAEGRHNHHYGWAVHGDRVEVERLAVRECTARGGVECRIKVWACN